MDNDNNPTQNTNWNPPPNAFAKKDLDEAMPSVLLGIFGLVVTFLFGCGLIGFVLSIMAFVKGKRAIQQYQSDPNMYTDQSYSSAKAGKVLGLIGIILGSLAILIILFIFIMVIFDLSMN
jgi:hypothetical protein